jgi:uncharacterized phiE125 gp8 family phage protein
MNVRIATDLVTEPVTLTEAKLFCKVTGTEEDDLFDILITAARRALEKYTSSSFAEKTIHATWTRHPEDSMYELPYGPIISVDAVYVIDEEGTEEALTLNSDYYVHGDQDLKVQVYSSWSTGVTSPSAVRIEYTAGYGDATTETLPAELKLAILKQIATDYEMRENIVPGSVTVLDNMARKLAAPYRKKLWF